jgi:hypothetical protein
VVSGQTRVVSSSDKQEQQQKQQQKQKQDFPLGLKPPFLQPMRKQLRRTQKDLLLQIKNA